MLKEATCMIRIFLCEDDPIQLSHWKKSIERFLVMYDMECELYCSATDPNELLRLMEDSEPVGLYFLDIDLKAEITGMELARKIRFHDPRGYIVFITTHGEAAPLTFKYKLEAMDFILKDEPDLLEERIAACIRNALENYSRHLHSGHHMLTIKICQDSMVLDQNDIYQVKSVEGSHQVAIHTVHGIYRISATLKEIASSLSSAFCYCNRSVIVNMDKVQKYLPEEKVLVLKNNEHCRVSFRLVGEVHNRLKNAPFLSRRQVPG